MFFEVFLCLTLNLHLYHPKRAFYQEVQSSNERIKFEFQTENFRRKDNNGTYLMKELPVDLLELSEKLNFHKTSDFFVIFRLIHEHA